MESSHSRRLCAGPDTCGGPKLEQSAPEGWILWYGPILEQLLKNTNLSEAHIEVSGTCSIFVVFVSHKCMLSPSAKKKK